MLAGVFANNAQVRPCTIPIFGDFWDLSLSVSLSRSLSGLRLLVGVGECLHVSELHSRFF